MNCRTTPMVQALFVVFSITSSHLLQEKKYGKIKSALIFKRLFIELIVVFVSEIYLTIGQ